MRQPTTLRTRLAPRRRASPRTALVLLAAAAGVLTACTTDQPLEPRESSQGHIGSAAPTAIPEIPQPVSRAPILPPPSPSAPSETYTVVVNEVPVKELLFALSRDAALNVDVHPSIDGRVTMNAIDQSLEQILERIAGQVELRYDYRGSTLVVAPDLPYLETYKLDYVNLSRETRNSVNISTQISNESITGEGGSGGGGDENNSTTEIKTVSNQAFWETVRSTVSGIIDEPNTPAAGAAGQSAPAAGRGAASSRVIVNPETGLLLVKATFRQHAEIQAYLNEVMASARRQVMIQATIVEVQLSDRYRAGIDFSRLIGGGGLLAQSVLAGSLGAAPFFLLDIANRPDGDPLQDTTLTVRLLKEFGDVRVLSSPTVMALNNQTAVFKAVENRVFFTVKGQVAPSNVLGGVAEKAFETTPHTVPVGLIMTVTPQIAGNDEVTLNVRPTITRTVGLGILDPNPDLTLVQSRVPEIAVRELESVLRLRSGQVAVLGGLMQDETTRDSDQVPFLGEIPSLGELFKARDDNFIKTELVVFLKPTIVRSPSIDSDQAPYRRLLPENLQPAKPQPTYGVQFDAVGRVE